MWVGGCDFCRVCVYVRVCYVCTHMRARAHRYSRCIKGIEPQLCGCVCGVCLLSAPVRLYHHSVTQGSATEARIPHSTSTGKMSWFHCVETPVISLSKCSRGIIKLCCTEFCTALCDRTPQLQPASCCKTPSHSAVQFCRL